VHDETEKSSPQLWGLVLAGGDSHRMGRDKGLLDYAGDAAARRAWRLLDSLCTGAFVSVRDRQTSLADYSGLPLIVDQGATRGPVAGLLAAWALNKDVAQLVLAADMPFVDEGLLQALIQSRSTDQLATAFKHPDGTAEPLCTIWEPRARALLLDRVRDGDVSLRRLMEVSPVKLLEPPEPAQIINVNTPEDYEAARKQIGQPSGAAEK